MAVRTAAFRSVGGFDHLLEASEDVDLCVRLRTAGLRLLADPRLASVHHGDPATLRALFRSELWRGRDNLRVSLREPMTPRSIPSIAIPIVELICLAAIPLAALLEPSMMITVVVALLLPVLGRTVIMAKRARASGVLIHVRAFAVASTYDLSRALALLLRTPHRRAARRQAQLLDVA